MQVQHRNLKQSYQYFRSALKRFNPKVSELKIYGTKNEKNLTDAFAGEFPIATNLQCFWHFKKCSIDVFRGCLLRKNCKYII